MEELTTLAQYGIAGVCIALIIFTFCVLRMVFKILGNHINHNTEALTKMIEKLDQDIRSQRDNTQVLRDLKNVLISKK